MKHGEQLAPLIERSMDEAGIVRQDLTAIAVGVGPGPFTGLRVGLVTARTLGFVLDIPVYGVCSLDVLALEAVDTGTVAGDFVVATDARRGRSTWRRTTWTAGGWTARWWTSRPTVATDVPAVGRGRLLYPDAFPPPGRADPAQCDLAGPRGGGGAGRAASTPSRSTCAGRTPRRPGPRKPAS